MRLSTFTAPTMTEAMSLVRARLGEDAIIVSTEEDEDGNARVTAAVERPERPLPAAGPDVVDVLNEALSSHGLSPVLVEKILCTALTFHTDDPLLALAGALTALLRFTPVEAAPRRPLLLIGPPGAGKTLALAKLAARAVLAGTTPRLVTADTVRAGAAEQLEAFARVLKLAVHRATTAARLGPLVAASKTSDLLLIDSAGINPYNAADRRELAAIIAASGAEPVLVLPAGGDAFDTLETARIFRDLGAERLIVTRLDMTQRLGSVMGAAEALRLAFSEASATADVANGLTPCNAVVLARLLLPHPAETLRRANTRKASP
jgi:flagellar biosynthesis protein FlhF